MTTDLLNSAPFVGRERELALLADLFESLRQESEQPAVVWLHGQAGCGKSALAEAFIDEVGSQAQVFRGFLDDAMSTSGGLGRMLADFFGCPRDDWEAAFRCVHQAYRDLGFNEFEARFDVIGLAEIIAAGAADETQRTRCGFESPRQKNVALTRLFRRLARTRPVVLWLDDADTSVEALSLVRHLLADNLEPMPVMVVGTARRGGIEAPSTRRERMIDDIVQRPRTQCVDVGPLAGEYQLELIDHLAPLAPQLAQRLARHTRGQPIFVIQLITDWLERDLLVEAPAEDDGQRLVLRDEGSSCFPNSVDLVWRRRYERALRSYSPAEADAARRAIEVAAVLGLLVEDSEWHAACEEAGVEPPARLRDALVAHELAEVDGHVWRFIHGTFQRHVNQRAREEGRWQRLNLACARAIGSLYGDKAAHRVANHLVEAGHLEEALEPLHLASRQFYHTGRYEMSKACLERRDELLDELGASSDDRRRVQNAIRRAHISLATGDPQRAVSMAREALATAETNRWDDEIGWAALALGRHAGAQGEKAHLLEVAHAAFERADDRNGRANTRSSTAYMAFTAGDCDRARQLFEEARDEFNEVGDDVMAARITQRIGVVSILEGRLDQATLEAEQALEMAQAIGDRVTEAGCWNSFGEIHRARRQWADAYDAYEKAARLHELAQNRNELVARFNLGLVDIAAGEIARARAELADLPERLIDAGLQSRLGMTLLAIACCAASEQDWEAFDERVDAACEEFARTRHAFVDEAWLAEHAGDLLAERDEPERARRVLELARERYQTLGRSTDAERIGARLASLAGG